MAFLMDVLQELSMRRATGMAAEDMEEGSTEQFATALYALMRAHKYWAELIAKKFQKHPTMAPTFNGFLFSKRATKRDFRRTEHGIGDLSEQIAGLQGKVDKIKK
jgi:hypothetical protein